MTNDYIKHEIENDTRFASSGGSDQKYKNKKRVKSNNTKISNYQRSDSNNSGSKNNLISKIYRSNKTI